jgi:hypothetical protein
MNLVCDVKPFGFMSLQSGVADHYNWFIMIEPESDDSIKQIDAGLVNSTFVPN